MIEWRLRYNDDSRPQTIRIPSSYELVQQELIDQVDIEFATHQINNW